MKFAYEEGRPLAHWPIGNGLLDRILDAERKALMPFCRELDLRQAEVLCEPGAPLTHV